MEVRCPKCGGELDIPFEAIGNRVECPYCEKKFLVEVVLKDPNGCDEPLVHEKVELDSKPQILKNLYVATSGRDYEECIKDGVEEAGYDCRITPQSGDQGVDLVVNVGGRSIAVQCKLYSSPVGNDAVQEVVAGAKYYECDNACVVSNSTFTASAQSLAAANSVALLHHRDLLTYLSKFKEGDEPTLEEMSDYEESDKFKELISQAEMGDEDARQKLGDYYCAQLERFAFIDLELASAYFTKAAHVGHVKTLQAYDDQKHALDSKETASRYDEIYGDPANPFGRVFEEMAYGTDNFKLPDDAERELEYDWFCAQRTEFFAQKEPMGRRRSSMLRDIKFVKKRWADKYASPKVTYYLGMCKSRGLGCETDVDVGAALIDRAARDGHLEAQNIIASMPEEARASLVESGNAKLKAERLAEERAREAKRLEEERQLEAQRLAEENRIRVRKELEELSAKVKALHRPATYVQCPKCGTTVSTTSRLCWSCDTPVPGWTGDL